MEEIMEEKLSDIELKIIGDGTPEGTYIEDQYGRRLNSVVKVRTELDQNGVLQVILTLVGVSVSINYNPVML